MWISSILISFSENFKIIEGNSNHAKFCRRVLGRVLSYAASLLPAVTETPQDIAALSQSNADLVAWIKRRAVQ